MHNELFGLGKHILETEEKKPQCYFLQRLRVNLQKLLCERDQEVDVDSPQTRPVPGCAPLSGPVFARTASTGTQSTF